MSTQSDMILPTREEYLETAILKMRPWFANIGQELPSLIRVSMGFPLGNRKAIGQCFASKHAADGAHNIFISPALADVATDQGILATLTHELVHTLLPVETGHRAPFQRIARQIGLQPPWTATTATDDLTNSLAVLAAELGQFPHGALDVTLRKKQGTRMIKCQCAVCGYLCRTVRQWIERSGPPCCPHHGVMEVTGL